MQRGVITALAFLFSWLLIAPLLASPSLFAAVPACCRKGGSHQCTMGSSDPGTSGSTLRTVGAKCPFRCNLITAASHFDFCAPGTGDSVYAGLLQHPAISPQTEANFRVSYDRSRQKRGPPVL